MDCTFYIVEEGDQRFVGAADVDVPLQGSHILLNTKAEADVGEYRVAKVIHHVSLWRRSDDGIYLTEVCLERAAPCTSS